jgi:transcriptional regulator with XRE-family HTH domain
VKRTRLAARRKVVGFSQETLAERLQVDRSTVVRWEHGESDPQPWKRTEMAQALRVSVEQLDELLTGESTATADPDEERADVTEQASESGGKRLCGGCGLPLSRYNPGELCQSCINQGKNEQIAEPGEVLIDGSRLAELRRESGMTQELLAERAGISTSLVSKLEQGTKKSARLRTLSSIARILEVPLDALLEGSSPEIANHNEAQPALRFTSPVNNSELGSITKIFSSLDEEENTEDPADVLKHVQMMHRSMIHPDVMEYLQDSTRRTITHYESLDHSILVPALRKQRAWLESLIEECGHPAQRGRLLETAGTISGVLGYVSVGSGNFSLARAYCLEAFELGKFTGNSNIQAWARGLQSFCEYYAGRYDEALSLANDGLSYAGSGPQSVRLTINGAARAMGKLGDAGGVDRAVDKPYELMSRNEVPDGVPSSISLECYSAAQTASNAATAYVSLGIPEKVQHYVDLAFPEINKSDSPWGRSLVLIDLAVSQVRGADADLDQASTLVHDAVTISADRPIISVQQRASEFVRDVVNRWGNVPQARTIRDAAFAAIERGK